MILTAARPINHLRYIWLHFYWHQHNVRMIFGINAKYFVGKCLAYSRHPIKVKNYMFEPLYTTEQPFCLRSRYKFLVFVLS